MGGGVDYIRARMHVLVGMEIQRGVMVGVRKWHEWVTGRSGGGGEGGTFNGNISGGPSVREKKKNTSRSDCVFHKDNTMSRTEPWL